MGAAWSWIEELLWLMRIIIIGSSLPSSCISSNRKRCGHRAVPRFSHLLRATPWGRDDEW
jgi:hypothetical protein